MSDLHGLRTHGLQLNKLRTRIDTDNDCRLSSDRGWHTHEVYAEQLKWILNAKVRGQLFS